MSSAERAAASVAANPSPSVKLRTVILGKAGYRGHIDIEIIEPDAARRRIGTAMQRLGGEQRVEGIDSTRRGAAGSGSTRHPCQIGKVAHAQLARAAQTVELAGQTPAAGL